MLSSVFWKADAGGDLDGRFNGITGKKHLESIYSLSNGQMYDFVGVPPNSHRFMTAMKHVISIVLTLIIIYNVRIIAFIYFFMYEVTMQS